MKCGTTNVTFYWESIQAGKYFLSGRAVMAPGISGSSTTWMLGNSHVLPLT